MARVRTERTRSKSAILEDIAHGVERLQSFIPQIEDLGRDGFPYLEGARVRTELQLKECIRRTFGEKSPEYEAYKKRRGSGETAANTKQTVAFIKSLIAALEDKKLEIQGMKPPPPAEAVQAPAPRPQIALVPPTTPTAQVSITPTAPITAAPVTMAVAVTTNLGLPTADPPSAIPSPSAVTMPLPPEPTFPQTNMAGAPPPQPPSSPSPSQAQAPSHAQTTQAAYKAETFDATSSAQGSLPDPATRPAVQGTTSTEQLESAATPAVPTPTESSKPKPETESTQRQKTRRMTGGESSATADPTPAALSRQENDPVEIVKGLCARFHLVARQLRLRGEYRATVDVEDELDVQDLLHALLRLHFDDIEPLEWIPSYSNGAPRIIFLLNDGRLAIVVKKTRTGLNGRDLAEQLRADTDHCRTYKRCSTVLCFVYDPEGRIGNPRGLEADLTSVSDQLTAELYVAPK
ncbi:MAG TPA: hypothetical protein VFS39_19265 [Nitrospira sp.]|nr:hypothetical protein [Nitrospira sp.]